MKLPQQQLLGAVRRHHRGRITRSATPAGVLPQDEWCEDVCHDTYEAGSEAQEDCLESCWED